MTRLYILVADSARAKVFKAEAPLKSLELVYDQVHFQSRKRRSEIDSDRGGVQRSGSGGFHGLAGDKDSHVHEEDEFARDLCKVLHTAHQAGNFDSLILAAPPHFLGELRHHLSRDCQKVLLKSLNKSLVQSTEGEILQHLA